MASQGAVRGSGSRGFGGNSGTLLTEDTINYQKIDRVERLGSLVPQTRSNWLLDTVARFKSALTVTFNSRTTWTFGSSSNTSRDGTIDYRDRVGDERNSTIIMSALDLLGTTFAQSPINVREIKGDDAEIVPNHDMVKLINKPNDFYSGKLLWLATIADYMFGNAYWLKERSAAGKPVRLYWVPSNLIKPAWPQNNPKIFISHYEYSPNGKPEPIAVENVVHFRNGMDPKNVRLGLGRLGAMLREIATDNEAAEYTHTILRNLGVAGMVITPKNEKVKVTDADAERIKRQVMQRTQGDRRGEPLVLSGASEVHDMGVDPSKLDLAAIRHLPEERLTALLGTPAVLLGLGTGLENATFSNVDGLRRIFYENRVIPLQDFIAGDLFTQLLRDYYSPEQLDGYAVAFDNSDVRVLKEDDAAVADRMLKELESGAITRNEYRVARNYEADAEDMYLLSSRIIPVPVKDILKRAEQEQQQNNNSNNGGNSNGNVSGNSGGSNGSSGSGSDKGLSQHTRELSTKNLDTSIDRIRGRMNAQCAADVRAYLQSQLNACIAQIDSQKSKAWRINWPRVQEDFEALKGVLEPWYKRALVAVHDIVQDVLDERYELSSSDERTYLKTTGLFIKDINNYTREQVKVAVAASVELDEDADELKARLRSLHVFSNERADLIALTELAQATNLAQIESYRASEIVVGIRVSDGDVDTVCKNVNGMKVAISEARSIPALGHPRCVRRFHHITDPSELESENAA